MPKISVISISYNAENTIEATIQSIVNQTCKDFEYIFVDGNSKDKTLEIAGKYKQKITKWISEPSNSIYDAMNKGILLAQGEYIIFLNAGDTLTSNDILENVLPELKNNDIIYGNICLKKLSKNIIKKNYLNKINLCTGKVFHQAEFIKINLLEQLGGFDSRFHILANHEFNLRAILKNNTKIQYVDKTISEISEENYSSVSPKNIRRQIKEKKIMQKMYFNKFEILLYSFLHIFIK